MKFKVFFPFFFLFWGYSVGAQIRYPIVGAYKKKSAQGMAIHDNYALLFNDGGHCRVYDFQTAELINEFDLSSSASTNHVNNSSFGIEKGQYNDFPLLYITECKNEFRCFVEEIFEDRTKLVQTITATYKGKREPVLIWVVDTQNSLLYAVTRTDRTLKTEGYSLNTITGYRLPQISEGAYVELTENDIYVRYTVNFSSILQGAHIRKNKLYIVTGLMQSLSERLDAMRAIQIVDLKKRKLKRSVDLTYVTTNEPEGIGFYGRKCLVYCGQEGGIYEIKLK